jgi:hypothetical protein
VQRNAEFNVGDLEVMLFGAKIGKKGRRQLCDPPLSGLSFAFDHHQPG